MFIYDVLAEAVQCNMEPFPADELQTRVSLYMTKKSRQTMESQYSEEFKVYAFWVMFCFIVVRLYLGYTLCSRYIPLLGRASTRLYSRYPVRISLYF